jgi:hypothetical protein
MYMKSKLGPVYTIDDGYVQYVPVPPGNFAAVIVNKAWSSAFVCMFAHCNLFQRPLFTIFYTIGYSN